MPAKKTVSKVTSKKSSTAKPTAKKAVKKTAVAIAPKSVKPSVKKVAVITPQKTVKKTVKAVVAVTKVVKPAVVVKVVAPIQAKVAKKGIPVLSSKPVVASKRAVSKTLESKVSKLSKKEAPAKRQSATMPDSKKLISEKKAKAEADKKAKELALAAKAAKAKAAAEKKAKAEADKKAKEVAVAKAAAEKKAKAEAEKKAKEAAAAKAAKARAAAEKKDKAAAARQKAAAEKAEKAMALKAARERAKAEKSAARLAAQEKRAAEKAAKQKTEAKKIMAKKIEAGKKTAEPMEKSKATEKKPAPKKNAAKKVTVSPKETIVVAASKLEPVVVPVTTPGHVSVKKKSPMDALSSVTSVGAKKFEIELEEPTDQVDNSPMRDLDWDGYGETYLYLLVRDPEWIFAYWEIDQETRQRLGVDWKTLVLQYYDVTDIVFDGTNAHRFFRVEVGNAVTWYQHMPASGRTWMAELGVLEQDGRFTSIYRSPVVKTPPAEMAREDLPVEWIYVDPADPNFIVRIPPGVSVAELLKAGRISEEILKRFPSPPGLSSKEIDAYYHDILAPSLSSWLLAQMPAGVAESLKLSQHGPITPLSLSSWLNESPSSSKR